MSVYKQITKFSSLVKTSKRAISIHFAKQCDTVNNKELITHTDHKYSSDDYRRLRFEYGEKIVTKKWAIDMIREDPVVICENRVVWSHSGGPLGHPKVYINLDKPGVHICGYSGRKFVLQKYYDEKKMGPSITYEQYLTDMNEMN